MIVCNLSVLAAERKINLSKISADTGLSRTTLTSLSRNKWKGIQADTLSALCIYLDVGIQELFSFYPFEFKVKGAKLIEESNTAIYDCIYYDRQHGTIDFSLSGNLVPEDSKSMAMSKTEHITFDADEAQAEEKTIGDYEEPQNYKSIIKITKPDPNEENPFFRHIFSISRAAISMLEDELTIAMIVNLSFKFKSAPFSFVRAELWLEK